MFAERGAVRDKQKRRLRHPEESQHRHRLSNFSHKLEVHSNDNTRTHTNTQHRLQEAERGRAGQHGLQRGHARLHHGRHLREQLEEVHCDKMNERALITPRKETKKEHNPNHHTSIQFTPDVPSWKMAARRAACELEEPWKQTNTDHDFSKKKRNKEQTQREFDRPG